MQPTMPMVSAFFSITPQLLEGVSGGCNQCPMPPPQAQGQPIQQMFCCPQFTMPQGGTSQGPAGDSSSGGGGDSVSVVINGVPQAAR
jgi:hypothetical protein